MNTDTVESKSLFDVYAAKKPVSEHTIKTEAGDVTVRSRVSMADMMRIVSLCVEMCTDQTTGEVKWELYDYVTRLLICAVYCGVDVPSDIEAGYDAVYSGGLYEEVTGYIENEQLDMIWASVRQKLMSRDALNASIAVGKLNALLESVQELMNAVGEAADGFDGAEALKALNVLNKMSTGKGDDEHGFG